MNPIKLAVKHLFTPLNKKESDIVFESQILDKFDTIIADNLVWNDEAARKYYNEGKVRGIIKEALPYYTTEELYDKYKYHDRENSIFNYSVLKYAPIDKVKKELKVIWGILNDNQQAIIDGYKEIEYVSYNITIYGFLYLDDENAIRELGKSYEEVHWPEAVYEKLLPILHPNFTLEKYDGEIHYHRLFNEAVRRDYKGYYAKAKDKSAFLRQFPLAIEKLDSIDSELDDDIIYKLRDYRLGYRGQYRLYFDVIKKNVKKYIHALLSTGPELEHILLWVWKDFPRYRISIAKEFGERYWRFYELKEFFEKNPKELLQFKGRIKSKTLIDALRKINAPQIVIESVEKEVKK